MATHRLFCTSHTLSEVIRLRKDRPYSTVLSMIEKLCDIHIKCEDKLELLKLSTSNPIVKKLLKRPTREIFYIESLEENISNPKADDIFLMLSSESKQYCDYRKKQGVLVTCSLNEMQIIDDLCNKHFRPYNLLTNRQKQRLADRGEEYEDLSSWKEVFDAVKISPINSAVIIDNYILHKFERREASLYNIIQSIVPSGLSIPFHLTVFINNENGKLKKEQMEQVVKEIHELKLGSILKVSLIAHTEKDSTHDRNILTNYHLVTSGKGFGVIDSRGVKENAQGEIRSTFHNIDFLPSLNSIKHQHSHLLNWIKDIYIDKRGMDAVYAFVVGDDFRNRLIVD